MNDDVLYKEIDGLLEAELECIESLQATSSEIQSLIDSEKLGMVPARLEARGEVLDLFVSLDRQINRLLPDSEVLSNSTQNQIHLKMQKLQKAVSSIMSMNHELQGSLKLISTEISGKLKQINKGRQFTKGFIGNTKNATVSSITA